MSELEKEFIAMRGALRKAFLLNVATMTCGSKWTSLDEVKHLKGIKHEKI